MGTIHAEEAVAQFRKCFDEAELEYNISDSDENVVRFQVQKAGVAVTTWFDVNQQMYGFDLLQGGHKSCGTFDEFEDYFGTYLSLHTIFIPNAKLIADAFEREVGIQTVYDNFSGNKQKGYTARFKVLGSEREVLIQRIPEGYLVRLVLPDPETKKYKLVMEYKYEMWDDGQIQSIPTMYSFVRKMGELYGADSTKKVQRVGDNMFCFTIDGLELTAEISFNYQEIRYHVTEVGEYDADITVSPEDPYNLSEVYMTCKDFYDDCMAGEEDQGVGSGEEVSSLGSSDDVPEVVGDEDETAFGDNEDEEPAEEEHFEEEPDADELPAESGEQDDSYDGEDETDYTSHIPPEDAEVIREEEAAAVSATDAPFGDEAGVVPSEESVEEPSEALPEDDEQPAEILPEQAEEPPKAVHVTGNIRPVTEVLNMEPQAQRPPRQTAGFAEAHQEVQPPVKAASVGDSSMNIESIKMVCENGSEVGVQFVVNGQPHIFGVAMVKAAGFPVKRIKDSVDIVYKLGMRMTEDEFRLRRYADESEDTQEMLDSITSAFFS